MEPLDFARGALLRVAGPVVRPFLPRRELRIATAATLAVLGCLLGASVAPGFMILAGPVVWGVPHIASDVRYLVVQPGLHRRKAMWFAVGIPLAVSLYYGGSAKVGLAAFVGAMLIARTDRATRCLGLFLSGLAVIAATRLGPWAELVFAHLHHFITVGVWWAYRPRDSKLHAIPIALFTLGAIAIATTDLTIGSLASAQSETLVDSLAPGLPAEWGGRMVRLFAYAQAFHYVIWLRLIPEEARAQATPRTFVRSARSLVGDFGWLPFGIIALATLVVSGWALADYEVARAVYGRISFVHGYLELAAFALLVAERRATILAA